MRTRASRSGRSSSASRRGLPWAPSTARFATGPLRPLGLDAVRSAIEAGAGEARSPEWCGRAIRILAEIGVVRMAGSRRCTDARGRILGARRARAFAQLRRQPEGSRGVRAIPDQGQRTELDPDAGSGVDGEPQNGDLAAEDGSTFRSADGHTRVGTREHTHGRQARGRRVHAVARARGAGAPGRPLRGRHRARRGGEPTSSTAAPSSRPSRSPASATPTSAGARARTSSRTRSRSRRSAPGCGSTPRPSAPRSCTTRSRTRRRASRRSRSCSASRSRAWSTASRS